MRKRGIALAAVVVALGVTIWAAAPTTLNDFILPGSQPNQSGNLESPDKCDNCHGGYDIAVEPAFNWRGSMMSQAARDPLFYACLAIANQDAPESGDLCIRCHTPPGWLGGNSTPTDGSALTTSDREGVSCDFCHRLVKPTQLGVNPYPDDPDYTTGTYSEDQAYLGTLTEIPETEADGMYIVDSDNAKRGPFVETVARHQYYYSPFHREAALCGTCHDVSNPAFTKDANGKYVPNDFDAPAPDFDPYSMFPIERTYSEWLMSSYNSPEGVYAPQFGGNKDTVRTCQDCHMRDTTGVGCNKNGAPVRDDLPHHDLTGGNTFIPSTIESVFPGETDPAALDSGVVRARRMLQKAATVDLTVESSGSQHLATVRVTNETGHKLPSGYPEGRRMWLNIRAYDSLGNLVYESGAYDTSTGVLTHDSDAKIYEIKPGLTSGLAGTLGLTPGTSFHFVVNDTIYSDNRIPPRGFTNTNFETIQSPPINYSYADGQYWDDTQYLIPGAATQITAVLYYQTTSKEYVEFLRDENTTNDWGDTLYDLWTANGKSAPEAMNGDTASVTPLEGNSPPVLASIGAKSTDENQLLSFLVTATDADGDSIVLTTSTLPDGAAFTDNGNDTGLFEWTPTYDQAGEYSVTFYATDDSGAVDSEAVPVTVNDVNRPPVLDSIGSKTVAEADTLSFLITATDPDLDSIWFSYDPALANATLTDHGDGTATFEFAPNYNESGTYPTTFIVSDGLLDDSELVSITVTDVNTPPELDSIGDRSIDEGALLTIAVSATDPQGDSIILSTSTLPDGATFSDNGDGTGSFDWTPTFEQADVYDVKFYATDTAGAADSELVTITVNDVNRAPVLDSIGNQTTTENDTLTLLITATDPDLDSIWFTYDPALTNATLTDHGDGTATFEFIPDFDQSGDHALTFVVSDGALADSELVTISVTNTNRPPVLDSIGNQTTAENDTLTLLITATDPDLDSIWFTYDPALTNATLTDHGDGTATFEFIPDFDQSGDHALTFVVSDGALADSELVTISVTNTNRPPVLDGIGNPTTAENDTLTLLITATDPDLDSIWFTYDPALTNATLTDHGDGTATFEFIPDFDQSGDHALTFVVSDGALADSELVTISVTNTNRPPILTEIGDKSVQAETNLNFSVSATDPDGTTPTLSTSTLPDGASFTPGDDGTGVFDWTPTTAQEGSHPVTFYATDGVATDSESISITVYTTNQPPSLATIEDQSVKELANLNFTVTAADPDGTPLMSMFSPNLPDGYDFTDNGDGSGTFDWTPQNFDAGVYAATFYATDNDDPSLVDSQSISITVLDSNLAPIVIIPGGQPNQVAEGSVIEIDFQGVDPDSTLATMTAHLNGQDTLATNMSVTISEDTETAIVTLTLTFSPDYIQGTQPDPTYYFVKVVACDAENPALCDSSSAYGIAVFNTNRLPVLDPVSDVIITAGELLEFDVAASDPDGETVTLTCENLPPGADFSYHGWDIGLQKYYGTFSWMPDGDQTGIWSDIRFVAADTIGSVDDAITVTVESAGCCVGITGNVDDDIDQLVDIGDLTALISYLYIPPNPEPVCPQEANIDGDGADLIDIGDLTALISYLYIPPNPQPAPCP
jgi:hypothetical protein